MRNLFFRILVFVVGIPALVALVLVSRESNGFYFHLLIVATSGIGAAEFGKLFEHRIAAYRGSGLFSPFVGAVIPVATMFVVHAGASPEVVLEGVLVVLAIILTIQVFRKKEEDFDAILPHVAAHAAVLLYPGLFLSYVIRFSSYNAFAELLLVLIGSVYLNDAGAYGAGMLFGKKSRAILAISPNKSLVGFLVGFLVSPAVILLARGIRPTLFPGSVWRALAFGAALGIATILGDLVESALKRSATVKDSGQLIPGRGGILDSMDSPLFAAPVFFYLYGPFFG